MQHDLLGGEVDTAVSPVEQGGQTGQIRGQYLVLGDEVDTAVSPVEQGGQTGQIRGQYLVLGDDVPQHDSHALDI